VSNPGKNLTVESVYKLMRESLIYFDLSVSNRDRAPREASILGCIVFTSNKGSARFEEDVPIPAYYKIGNRLYNLPMIRNRINYALKNYDSILADFNHFREKIVKEKEQFNQTVKHVFMLIFKNHYQ